MTASRTAMVIAIMLTSKVGLAQDLGDSVNINFGQMSYTMETLEPIAGSNTSNFALEWAHYLKKDLSPYVGYRTAYDPEIKRNRYQAGFAGFRYYYLGLGVPITSHRNLSKVYYNFRWRPYVESHAVLGRYLILTKGDLGALDASSEFYGFALGSGISVGIGHQYAIDFRTSFEYALGYGPIEFSATTLMILLGTTYYI